MAAIPKECYALFEELVNQRKKNQLSFEDVFNALTQKPHWSVVDWKRMRSRKRNEILNSPILIVCATYKTIEKMPRKYDIHDMNKAIRNGKKILIVTAVAKRWGYAIVENVIHM